MAFELLVVCTANICRSPATARALRVHLAALGIDEGLVRVSSAGIRALSGAPMCAISSELIDEQLVGMAAGHAAEHESRALTADVAAQADLILTADRSHRRDLLAMLPAVRARTFTVRQAARLASWVAAPTGTLPVARAAAAGEALTLDPLDPRIGAPPLPQTPLARLHWFAGELDAARGLAPTPIALTGTDWDVDDIGDPHVEGPQIHALAAQFEMAAAAAISAALAATVAA